MKFEIEVTPEKLQDKMAEFIVERMWYESSHSEWKEKVQAALSVIDQKEITRIITAKLVNEHIAVLEGKK